MTSRHPEGWPGEPDLYEPQPEDIVTGAIMLPMSDAELEQQNIRITKAIIDNPHTEEPPVPVASHRTFGHPVPRATRPARRGVRTLRWGVAAASAVCLILIGAAATLYLVALLGT